MMYKLQQDNRYRTAVNSTFSVVSCLNQSVIMCHQCNLVGNAHQAHIHIQYKQYIECICS